MLQRATPKNRVSLLFKLQIGKDRDEVGIATAFADTIDRTLNLLAAGVDR